MEEPFWFCQNILTESRTILYHVYTADKENLLSSIDFILKCSAQDLACTGSGKAYETAPGECLDPHFPLTAFLRPGANVVLIETEGSQGVLPLEAAGALALPCTALHPAPCPCPGSERAPWEVPARESDKGLSHVREGAAFRDGILFFRSVSVISITQAMHSLEGVWLISLYKELSDTLLIYQINCTAYYL